MTINIGDIKKRKNGNIHVWVACIDCGKQRWVPRVNGSPFYLKCRSCASRRPTHYHPVNELNSQWKGDAVTYGALHDWVRRHKSKPESCEICHIKPAYDLACITGIYSRDIKNFAWLCRSCHMVSDGRLKALKDRNSMGKIGSQPDSDNQRGAGDCSTCGKVQQRREVNPIDTAIRLG